MKKKYFCLMILFCSFCLYKNMLFAGYVRNLIVFNNQDKDSKIKQINKEITRILFFPLEKNKHVNEIIEEIVRNEKDKLIQELSITLNKEKEELDFLDRINTKFPKLNFLDIANVDKLNIESVPIMEKITKLAISNSDIIDENGLLSLLDKFPNLKEIELDGFNKLINIDEVIEKFKNLDKLGLYRLPNFTYINVPKGRKLDLTFNDLPHYQDAENISSENLIKFEKGSYDDRILKLEKKLKESESRIDLPLWVKHLSDGLKLTAHRIGSLEKNKNHLQSVIETLKNTVETLEEENKKIYRLLTTMKNDLDNLREKGKRRFFKRK